MSIAIRHPGSGEAADLRNIWKTVFGGSDEEIFFNNYYSAEYSIIAELDGSLAAAGYILPIGSLIIDERSIPCAMIYAVATLPGHRSRGLGKSVVNELISSGRAAGYPAIVLCPSEDSLFEYYSVRTDLRDWFYVSETVTGAPQKKNSVVNLSILDPDEYARLRGSLLSDVPHIQMDARALSYQNMLCHHYGGGMYLAAAENGSSCLTVELQPDGEVLIKELIMPDNKISISLTSDILSAIASMYPAGRYVVRSPVSRIGASFTNGKNGVNDDCKYLNPNLSESVFRVRRFGMLSAADDLFNEEYAISSAPWYGLAFD